jgi:phosphate:Na+ symporter
LALDRVRLELGHLGDHVVRMMQAAPPIVLAGSRAELQRIARMDDDVDRLHVAILDYLRMLGRGELSEQDAQLMGNFLAAANYLENTGDLISTNLVAQGEQRLDKQLRISPWTIDVLRPLGDEVVRALQDALTALVHGDPSLAADVVGRKAHVYGKADEAMEHLSRRLLVDEPHRLDAFRVESDIVGQIKRLFYNARRIAKLAAEGGAAEDAPAREGKEA